MTAIYWDTSALLKLYAPEADSSDYRRLLLSRTEAVAISTLHLTELYYALSAKEKRGEIVANATSMLFQSFKSHIRAHRYQVINVDQNVASRSRQILDKCVSATPAIPLRSLDGLHLGCMNASGIQLLVTADARMQQAAHAMSIRTINP